MKTDNKTLQAINKITENSDGSEKRIGDYIIKHDYGADAYYVGSGGDVVIPEEIGDVSLSFTFQNTNNIRSLQYPSCISSLWAEDTKPYHFGSTDNLEKLVLSEGLERIEGNGFYAECKKLKEVVLPHTLEYLGSGAFKNTPWYKDNLKIIDGCHYLERFLVSSDKDIEHANIREGTVMICGFAFKSRKNLVSVSIPNSLKTIGEQAFNGCEKLKEVKIPDSVERIEASCFTGCASLIYFEALNTNVSISPNAFGSKKSTKIYYPEYAYIPTEIIGEGIERLIFSYCYLTSRERFTPEIQNVNDAVIKKNKAKLLNLILENGNVAGLQNIAPFVLTKKNISDVIESAKKYNKTEIIAFLLDWSNKNIKKDNIDKRLEVKENGVR